MGHAGCLGAKAAPFVTAFTGISTAAKVGMTKCCQQAEGSENAGAHPTLTCVSLDRHALPAAPATPPATPSLQRCSQKQQSHRCTHEHGQRVDRGTIRGRVEGKHHHCEDAQASSPCSDGPAGDCVWSRKAGLCVAQTQESKRKECNCDDAETIVKAAGERTRVGEGR